ncbi:MAG: hypothetical protein ABL949_14810 [Fimbriimonadaceae bacterium]
MEVKSWLGRKNWYLILGVPLLSFALAPFPFGMGMMFVVWDTVRGHPQWSHGSQPSKFVGLWVRDELVKHDFRGQAFYLLADGRVAGMAGMTRRHWHFDNNTLFVDSVSMCGNCYSGNLTTAHTIAFKGTDQLAAANKDTSAKRGITGTYRRIEITPALKAELNIVRTSEKYKSDELEDEWYRARYVLEAIEQFETMSKAQ